MTALTIEQMKILQEKGLACNNASCFYYYGELCFNYSDNIDFDYDNRIIPAFTLEDILSIFPIISKKYSFDGEDYISNYTPELCMNGKFSTIRYNFEDYDISFQEEPLEIAYKLLI